MTKRQTKKRQVEKEVIYPALSPEFGFLGPQLSLKDFTSRGHIPVKAMFKQRKIGTDLFEKRPKRDIASSIATNWRKGIAFMNIRLEASLTINIPPLYFHVKSDFDSLKKELLNQVLDMIGDDCTAVLNDEHSDDLYKAIEERNQSEDKEPLFCFNLLVTKNKKTGQLCSWKRTEKIGTDDKKYYSMALVEVDGKPAKGLSINKMGAAAGDMFEDQCTRALIEKKFCVEACIGSIKRK